MVRENIEARKDDPESSISSLTASWVRRHAPSSISHHSDDAHPADTDDVLFGATAASFTNMTCNDVIEDTFVRSSDHPDAVRTTGSLDKPLVNGYHLAGARPRDVNAPTRSTYHLDLPPPPGLHSYGAPPPLRHRDYPPIGGHPTYQPPRLQSAHLSWSKSVVDNPYTSTPPTVSAGRAPPPPPPNFAGSAYDNVHLHPSSRNDITAGQRRGPPSVSPAQSRDHASLQPDNNLAHAAVGSATHSGMGIGQFLSGALFNSLTYIAV